MFFPNSRVLPLTLAFVAFAGQWACAQGCVAAHSNQRSFDELMTGGGEVSPSGSHNWIHNLTVDVGYRVFDSNKYFQGSTEIPRPSAVENHQNIFDVAFQYQLRIAGASSATFLSLMARAIKSTLHRASSGSAESATSPSALSPGSSARPPSMAAILP